MTRIVKHKLSLFLAVFMLLLGLAFRPVMDAPFIWDDEVMVQQNESIRSLSSIHELFTQSAFGEAYNPSKFYRPMQMLTYAIDYKVWGLNPFGFRLSSLIIHACAMMALFAVIRRLFDPLIALLVTLFFALHPIQLENLAYISGRGDVLNLLFMCLCSVIYFCRSQTWLNQVLFVLLFVLGVLSKENIITLPIALLAYAIIHKQKSHLPALMISSVLAISFSLYRVFAAGGSATLSWISEASLIERLATLPYIIMTYLRLFVAPYDLHMDYQYVASSFLSSHSLLLIVLICSVFYLYRRFKSKHILSSIAMFLILLAPVHQVFFPLAATLREHWLVLPSFSLLLLLGMLLQKSLQVKRGLTIVVSICTILFMTELSYQRNIDWANAKRLYTNDLKFEAKSFVMHNNLGVLHFREGDFKRAQKAFYDSVINSPRKGYDVALNNYGVVLENQGDDKQAAQFYLKSIQVGSYELAYLNLAALALKHEDIFLAKSVIEEGLKEYPSQKSLLFMKDLNLTP